MKQIFTTQECFVDKKMKINTSKNVRIIKNYEIFIVFSMQRLRITIYTVTILSYVKTKLLLLRLSFHAVLNKCPRDLTIKCGRCCYFSDIQNHTSTK